MHRWPLMYRPLLVERLGCDEVLRDINSSPPRGRILNEKLAAMGRVASSFCPVIRPISSGPQVTPLVSKLRSGFSMTHRRARWWQTMSCAKLMGPGRHMAILKAFEADKLRRARPELLAGATAAAKYSELSTSNPVGVCRLRREANV